MVKQIIELFMVIIIGFLPLGTTNDAPPATVSHTAVVASQMDDAVKAARFQNMLDHNQCFGDMFADTVAVCESSMLSLCDSIEDGYISKALVDSFALGMYGVDCTPLPESDRAGFYRVPSIGFDRYRHTVDSFSYVGDGTITVYSTVRIGDDAATYPCESVFFADGSSPFGYILLECNITW